MNDTELWARVGRQAVRIDEQNAAFASVLGIFADVLSGKTDPRRVLINLTTQTITVGPEGSHAMTPAAVNGLPECAVYAPFKFPELPPPQDPPGGSD